ASTQGDHRRPLGEGRLETRHSSAFLVDGHPERQIGVEARCVVSELGHLFGVDDVAGEEDDAAEAELLFEGPQLCRDLMAGESGDQQLADLPAKRARRHYSNSIKQTNNGTRPSNGTEAACSTAVARPFDHSPTGRPLRRRSSSPWPSGLARTARSF